MADILKKIKEWDFTNKDSSVTLNLDYAEIAAISDVVDRKMWFTDEVDANIIDTIVYNILRYNAIDKGIAEEERKPIILYVSSPGGSVYDGLSLCSAIEASKTPVYTVNVGECCSMGLFVYLVGKKRYTMPHSIFLMHDGSAFGYDSSAKLKDRVDFDSGTLANHMRDIILNHTSLTKKQYEDKYRKEWYFMAQESKKFGFTDYIIGEDCDIDEIL